MPSFKACKWLFFLLFSTASLAAVEQYNLALCAIFRDDKSYLKEWIEFHRLLGVEHFYLYNHLSIDHPEEVLRPYIQAGIVDLIDWPHEAPTRPEWGRVQNKAYNDALKKFGERVKWLAILDTDEFLFPVKKDNLQDFLKDFEAFGGVGVNWQCYGTSHVAKIPPGKQMIEMLIYKIGTHANVNKTIKSIVQPKYVDRISGPHFATYKNGYSQVNSNREPFKGPFAPYVVIDQIRINHYWTRDEHFFYKCKLTSLKRRGCPDIAAHENTAKQLNQEIDVSISRFIPLLR
jgi:hypothetical protein